MKMASFAKTGSGLTEDSLTKQAFYFTSLRTVASALRRMNHTTGPLGCTSSWREEDSGNYTTTTGTT